MITDVHPEQTITTAATLLHADIWGAGLVLGFYLGPGEMLSGCASADPMATLRELFRVLLPHGPASLRQLPNSRNELTVKVACADGERRRVVAVAYEPDGEWVRLE
jgi:hypothetical protein